MISKRTNKSQFKALRTHSLNKLHQETQLKQLLRRSETILLDESTEVLKCTWILELFFFYKSLWFCLHKIFTCCVCIVKINFVFILWCKHEVSVLPNKYRRGHLLLSKATREFGWMVISSILDHTKVLVWHAGPL